MLCTPHAPSHLTIIVYKSSYLRDVNYPLNKRQAQSYVHAEYKLSVIYVHRVQTRSVVMCDPNSLQQFTDEYEEFRV